MTQPPEYQSSYPANGQQPQPPQAPGFGPGHPYPPAPGFMPAPLPPKPGKGKQVFGWILLVIGGLFALGRCSAVASGNTLPSDGAAAQAGYLTATVLFILVPLVAGGLLLNSHAKAMKRWREATGQR